MALISYPQNVLMLEALSYLTANGATDPNSAIGNQGGQLLIANISDTISTLNSLNLPKHIPVGTSDAGAFFNTQVLEAVEYGVGVGYSDVCCTAK